MKKIIGLTGILLLLLDPWAVKADEGMWLVHLMEKINYETMKAKGLQLTPEQIYNEKVPSLKDAIVAIDHGSCSGSIISEKGLMITNHHCAYDDIQKLSTMEHDYLKDGFWAKNQTEEIVIPGKTVMFLEKVIEVTEEYKELKKHNKGIIPSYSSRRVNGIIEKKYAEPGFEVSCEAMLRGDKYYIFYYKVYTDVRLVGAPSAKIGAFGGDTDNWSWPQHKGDFSLYRVYADKNGNPAKYSKDNVPLKPKYVLPISKSGYNENDFMMILGYPGSTARYTSSWGVKHKLEVSNPAMIDVRTIKLDLMREAMKKDPQVKIQYASKYFSASNYWKYAIGETKYTNLYNVVGKRQEEEAKLAKWIDADPAREAKYGTLLNDMHKAFEIAGKYEPSGEYHQEAIVSGADVFSLSLRVRSMARRAKKENCCKLKKDCKECDIMKKSSDDYFKDYNETLDREIFAAMLKLYNEKVLPEFIPVPFTKMVKKYNGDFTKMTNDLYDRSFLANKEKFSAFLGKDIDLKNAVKDPLVALIDTLVGSNFLFRNFIGENQIKLRVLQTEYVAALVEMNQGKEMYPDANSTMRVTYGTVGSYSAQDAVTYSHRSSINGYPEKYIPGDMEFDLPADLLPAIQKRDWGQYADKDGQLYTGFVSDLDITGGNSGSAIINARGELTGLAYDGNWESMAGSLYYHPDFNKCVSVDIRFVLWLIDKYAGARYLIDEMKIAS